MDDTKMLEQWIRDAETGVGRALKEGRGVDALSMLEALNKLATRQAELLDHQQRMARYDGWRNALSGQK